MVVRMIHLIHRQMNSDVLVPEKCFAHFFTEQPHLNIAVDILLLCSRNSNLPSGHQPHPPSEAELVINAY